MTLILLNENSKSLARVTNPQFHFPTDPFKDENNLNLANTLTQNRPHLSIKILFEASLISSRPLREPSTITEVTENASVELLNNPKPVVQTAEKSKNAATRNFTRRIIDLIASWLASLKQWFLSLLTPVKPKNLIEQKILEGLHEGLLNEISSPQPLIPGVPPQIAQATSAIVTASSAALIPSSVNLFTFYAIFLHQKVALAKVLGVSSEKPTKERQFFNISCLFGLAMISRLLPKNSQYPLHILPRVAIIGITFLPNRWTQPITESKPFQAIYQPVQKGIDFVNQLENHVADGIAIHFTRHVLKPAILALADHSLTQGANLIGNRAALKKRMHDSLFGRITYAATGVVVNEGAEMLGEKIGNSCQALTKAVAIEAKGQISSLKNYAMTWIYEQIISSDQVQTFAGQLPLVGTIFKITEIVTLALPDQNCEDFKSYLPGALGLASYFMSGSMQVGQYVKSLGKLALSAYSIFEKYQSLLQEYELMRFEEAPAQKARVKKIRKIREPVLRSMTRNHFSPLHPERVPRAPVGFIQKKYANHYGIKPREAINFGSDSQAEVIRKLFQESRPVRFPYEDVC